MKDTIQKLIALGHKVTWYKRKDGGVRILSIDGTHYKGSTGNKVARLLTGDTLSEARGRQLGYLAKRQEKHGKFKKLPSLPEDLVRQLKNQQAKWRKMGKKKGDQGMPSMAGLRWTLQHEGREEAERLLSENERYRQGYAYTENVRALLDRLNREIRGKFKEEWKKIHDYIEANIDIVREDWLQEIYTILGSPKFTETIIKSEELKLQLIKLVIGFEE